MQKYTMGLRVLPPTTTINAFTNSHHLLRLFNDTPCIGRSVGNSTARQFDFTPLCLQQPLRIKEKPVRKFSGSSRSLVMASVSQAPQSLAPDNMDEETNLWQQVQSHQETAARLPAVEEIRTLLDSSLRGMLSTFSQHYEGYPSGSMVDICCGEDGCPILAISSLAVHTKDLLANPKCSLLVTKDPTDRTELVITVHGDAVFVPENEREASRASYLRKHPEAFWVDFGDFQFVRIEPKCVRYVSGVATAMLGSGEFTGEEYKKAKVDPISQFSIPVASHMNRDHAEDTKLIVQHFVSIKVDHAQIIDLDRLGFNVKGGIHRTLQGVWHKRNRVGAKDDEFGLHLLGTTSTWFLLDIAFYSNNLSQKDIFTAVAWLPAPKNMNAIEEVFRVAKAQSLIALCATVPGYWFTVALIDRIGRFAIQLMGFFFMTVFMFALAIPYHHWRSGHPIGFVIMYSLTFFFSNFGPNSTTFVVPAEIFPARLRSTCHGISATAGKAGAIVGAFGFVYAAESTHANEVDLGYSKGIGTKHALLLLAIISALGFFFTFLVPETKGRSLEEISGENEDSDQDEEQQARSNSFSRNRRSAAVSME